MFIWLAPACAKGSSKISGFEHIKWTSKKSFVSGRIVFTTAGPKEMLGTKWPSMMSRWSQSAPEASTRSVSRARRPKLEARSEGARMMDMDHDPQIRRPKAEIRRTECSVIRISDFGFLSDFGLR